MRQRLTGAFDDLELLCCTASVSAGRRDLHRVSASSGEVSVYGGAPGRRVLVWLQHAVPLSGGCFGGCCMLCPWPEGARVAAACWS